MRSVTFLYALILCFTSVLYSQGLRNDNSKGAEEFKNRQMNKGLEEVMEFLETGGVGAKNSSEAAVTGQQYLPARVLTNNEEVTYVYNTNGQLLTETEVSDNGTYKEINTYDASGNLLVSVSETWENGVMVFGDRETYTYNAQGQEETVVYEEFMDGSWENASRFTYTYTAQGMVETSISEEWEEGAWENALKQTYSYGTNGSLSEVLSEFWSGSGWDKGSRYVITYDGNGNMTMFTTEMWFNNDWMKTSEMVSVYDGSGNLTQVTSQNYFMGQQMGGSRITYTYDGEGNQTEQVMENWEAGTWVNSMRITSSYENGQQSVSVTETWNNGAWENLSRMSYKYGTGGKTEELSEIWNSGSWVNDWKNVYIRDANGNTTRAEHYAGADLSAADGQLWIDYNQEMNHLSFFAEWAEVTYNMFTDVNDEPVNELTYELEGNYPNPFNPSTIIRFRTADAGPVKLTVFNQLGETVSVITNGMLPAGVHETRFGAEGLASGIYFYSLEAGGLKFTKKMMLIK